MSKEKYQPSPEEAIKARSQMDSEQLAMSDEREVEFLDEFTNDGRRRNSRLSEKINRIKTELENAEGFKQLLNGAPPKAKAYFEKYSEQLIKKIESLLIEINDTKRHAYKLMKKGNYDAIDSEKIEEIFEKDVDIDDIHPADAERYRENEGELRENKARLESLKEGDVTALLRQCEDDLEGIFKLFDDSFKIGGYYSDSEPHNVHDSHRGAYSDMRKILKLRMIIEYLKEKVPK